MAKSSSSSGSFIKVCNFLDVGGFDFLNDHLSDPIFFSFIK
jgi:hypothetical protein